jgi:hypothetical protein
MKRNTLIGISLGAIFFAGCSMLDEAKAKLAEVQKEDAADISADCEMYKTQFLQSGDSTWLNLYNTSCQDDFIAANTPEGLDANCEVKYATMIKETEALIMSLRGVCDSTNIDTEPQCIDAKQKADDMALSFQKECGVDNFYYPTPEDVAPPTTTIDGQCAWKAWIPSDVRTGTDSTVMLVCREEKPVCSTVIINDEARIVETHTTIEGDTVYLPCIQDVQDIFAPCDFNKDRFVDPIEAQQCQSGTIEDPCDWDRNGVLDEFEKMQCNAIPGDSGSVNPGLYDPCDWNYDGKVDPYELERCKATYACKDTEQPFFDPESQKQVCVALTDIPKCEYPMWPEYVQGGVKCMDPCDFNRDLTVDEAEKGSCAVIEMCKAGTVPFFDPNKQMQVCIPEAEIPLCETPTYAEFVNGALKCIDPCDWNRDGVVDTFETSQCFVPPMDSMQILPY